MRNTVYKKREIGFAESGMESEIPHSPLQFAHIAFYLLTAPLHIGSDLQRYLLHQIMVLAFLVIEQGSSICSHFTWHRKENL